ncbi:MAG TPA: DJ-1/PfpI family protein [Bacillota bacterium]|nr:DJ-1/PfpI family protein [Bacillota bacterium]
MKFACLLSDGFEDTEALATVNLLRRTEIQIDLISVFNKKTVTGSNGTTVIPDKIMKRISEEDYDGLLIPGGRHSYVLRESDTVKQLVSLFYEHKKWLMAICAAPTVFGMMGIMDGVKYTSFPGTEEDMGKAIRVDKKAVHDGKFITATSVGAVYEFVFEIVQTVFDQKALDKLKERIVY